MELSEFIAKNNERPDFQLEWQKSKELMRTLLQSGAVELLEQLRQSILSNPILRQSPENKIRLDKTLIVANAIGVRALAKTDSENPITEIIIGEKKDDPYRNKGMVLPTAFLIFRYSFHTVGIKGTPFKEASYRYNGESDAIILGCSNSEEIGGMSIPMASHDIFPIYYPAHATMLKTQELKTAGRIDEFLGKIYSKTPARRTSGEIEWY